MTLDERAKTLIDKNLNTDIFSKLTVGDITVAFMEVRREAIEECAKILDDYYAPDVHNVASKLRALSQAPDKGGK